MKLFRHLSVALLGVVLLAGCGQAVASETAVPIPVPPSPGDVIEEAAASIADVAEEAQAVNDATDPDNVEQAEGIVMRSDEDRGLDATDVTDTALAGGCVPGYGTEGECLPPVPPRLAAEHAGHGSMLGEEMAAFYSCADIRQLLPDGIEVVGEDQLGLDRDGSGVACDDGDG